MAVTVLVRLCAGALMVGLFTGFVIAGDNTSVRVDLKDGTQVVGVILQLQPDAVKIDPVGAILLRTIKGDDIVRIEFIETGEILTFPIDTNQIPAKLSEDPQERMKKRSNGVRPFGITAAFGMSMPSGAYYDGIGSGIGFQLGGYYRFSQDDPYGVSFFCGFSYNYNRPGFEIDKFCYYGDCVIFESCTIHQYNFDFGANTKVSKSDSYLYFLSGLSIVSNNITSHLEDSMGKIWPKQTYSETHAAFRLYGGGVIGISSKLGIDLRAGFDFLLSKSQPNTTYPEFNYYENQGPDVMGTIIAFGVGIVWEP